MNLTHAVVYLSMAPKSNALYMAYESAKRDAQKMLSEPVPLVIRNAANKAYEGVALRRGDTNMRTIRQEKLTAMQCLPVRLPERSITDRRNRAAKQG